MSVDEATVERLAADHPEQYRGGRVDAGRIKHVSAETAWKRAAQCLEDGNPGRAAYWVGWATTAET